MLISWYTVTQIGLDTRVQGNLLRLVLSRWMELCFTAHRERKGSLHSPQEKPNAMLQLAAVVMASI